jgi:hypothetical protein
VKLADRAFSLRRCGRSLAARRVRKQSTDEQERRRSRGDAGLFFWQRNVESEGVGEGIAAAVIGGAGLVAAALMRPGL